MKKQESEEALAYVFSVDADESKNKIQLRQAIDTWLYYATPEEVRRNWRDHWGALPGWAISPSSAAAALGSISTPKKASSSRENGKKGGRPKTEVFEMNWETNGFKAWKTKKGVVVEIWNRNQGMHTGRKALLAGKTTLPTENDWQTYLYAAKYPESSITLKKGHKVQ